MLYIYHNVPKSYVFRYGKVFYRVFCATLAHWPFLLFQKCQNQADAHFALLDLAFAPPPPPTEIKRTFVICTKQNKTKF